MEFLEFAWDATRLALAIIGLGFLMTMGSDIYNWWKKV